MPSFIFYLLFTSGACLVISMVPSLAWVGGIAWGTALLLGGHRLDRRLLVIMAALNLLLLFGLSGNSNLFLVMTMGLPGLVMGLMLSEGQSYYAIQKWGMLAAILLVGLYWGLALYASEANVILGDPAQMDRYVAESIKTSQETGLIDVYVEQGYDRKELEGDIEMAARWLFMLQPALHIINIMLGIWVILRFAAFLGARQGLTTLKPKPFREEIMPWQLSWVVIAALTMWLWGRDEMNNIYYAASNLLVVMLPVTAYYGLAVQTFKFDKMKPSFRRWGWGIFAVITLVFTPVALIFISILGLFDSLLDYRKLNLTKEGT